MVDVSGGIYEVLTPLDECGKSPLSNGKGRTGTTFAPGYSTYSVPRGLNGTPPRTKAIPPTVPPRNRNMSEGDPFVGSQGTSPNDKWRGFARSLSSAGITKSPSISSISEELPLADFITKYGKSLPHRVKVCKGFYGVSDQTAVTTGDILSLHFLKTTKAVRIETGPDEGSTTYNVPLTSAIQFSPLYDPNDRIDEATRGFFFSTAADILATKTLPKIVRATRSFQGGNSDNSVAENEILLIKGTKSKLTSKQLKVYSLTSNRKKSLNENCHGSFTTAPDKLRMYLYEITVNLADTLPCKALVTLFNSAHQDSVLDDLQGAVVTLRKVTTETSVIATSSCTDEGEVPEVAEMPVSLDIEVESVALDEHDLEHLRKDTCYMYENFDPFSVCLYMTKASRRLYDIQCMLYTKLMHGNDFRGLEIIRPNTISSTPKRHPPNIPVQRTISNHSSSSSISSSTPSSTTTPTGLFPPHPLHSSGSTNSSVSSGYQSLTSPPKAGGSAGDYYVVMASGKGGKRTVSASQDDISDHSGDSVLSHREQLKLLEGHNNHLEETVAKNAVAIQKLQKQVGHFNKRIESLLNHIRIMSSDDFESMKNPSRSPSGSPPVSVENRPPAPLPAASKRNGRVAPPRSREDGNATYHLVGGSLEISPSPSPPNGSHFSSVYSSAQDDEISMSNTDFLTTLNQQQVLELLDTMGLKQYQDNFKEEKISGEFLAECDDDMLTNDLRVTSKLHRKRLLKVISGQHSARSIMNGEDPYTERRSKPELLEQPK